MGIDLTLLQELVRIGSPRLHICPYFALFLGRRLKHHGQLEALRNKSRGFSEIKKESTHPPQPKPLM